MMSNKAMKERHWDRIATLTGHTFDVTSDNFLLRNIMEAPLLKHKDDIEDICISAVKEKDIEAKLKQVCLFVCVFVCLFVCVFVCVCVCSVFLPVHQKQGGAPGLFLKSFKFIWFAICVNLLRLTHTHPTLFDYCLESNTVCLFCVCFCEN